MLVLAGSLGPLFGHRRCPAATIGLQSNCQSRRLPARVKLRISSPAWLGRSCPSTCGATAIMYASPTAFRVRAQVARHVWLDIGIRARSSYPGLLSVIATANPPSAPSAKERGKTVVTIFAELTCEGPGLQVSVRGRSHMDISLPGFASRPANLERSPSEKSFRKVNGLAARCREPGSNRCPVTLTEQALSSVIIVRLFSSM